MHIIMGATGRVGSAVVSHLLKNGQPVKGITRNKDKASDLQRKGADVAIADAKNMESLVDAFQDGDMLFIITPETGEEKNVIEEGRLLLENYRNALKKSPIRKVVAISSVGAQHEKGTGNLQISYMLEHAFRDLPVKQTFIRPAYYFSNWMPYFAAAKDSGTLPSFFPPDLLIPMVSPEDVGRLAAEILLSAPDKNSLYELEGPKAYSAADVANAFSKELGKTVRVEHIARRHWERTLKEEGMPEDGIKNFIEMTEAVIDGRATPEGEGTIPAKGTTTLQQYIHQVASKEKVFS
jgi:uncharacterized protein YbjT (DUF2867 family)